jgi:hypothetical protein
MRRVIQLKNEKHSHFLTADLSRRANRPVTGGDTAKVIFHTS